MVKFANATLAFLLIGFALTACSGGESEPTYAPPSASAFQSFLNSGWGEPACTTDGCFSIKAISVEQSDKPWVWCALIENTSGTAYYGDDGLIARIDWDQPTNSEQCYRVATNENGEIQYVEPAN